MTETTRQYQKHRENQRSRILSAAETLFIQSGIDAVSMSDIARLLKVTRNTLYAYFPDKQEIAWAILQSIFEQSRFQAQEPPDGTACQQIEERMFAIMHQLQTHPEHARFIVEFDSLYARELNADRMRQATGRDQGTEPVFARLVRQGIADGSLRADLDPALTSAAIWNLLSGLNSRFALLGNLIELEYQQTTAEIYHEICRCFLRGIQNVKDQKD